MKHPNGKMYTRILTPLITESADKAILDRPISLSVHHYLLFLPEQHPDLSLSEVYSTTHFIKPHVPTPCQESVIQGLREILGSLACHCKAKVTSDDDRVYLT